MPYARGNRGASDESSDTVRFPNVTLVALEETDLIRDTFDPMARDGAALIEIGVRMQKALGAISLCTHGVLADAARQQAWRCYERAREALVFEEDRKQLEILARDTAGDAAR